MRLTFMISDKHEWECAACRHVIREGEGFIYALTDRHGFRLYAAVHTGDCDERLSKKLQHNYSKIDE